MSWPIFKKLGKGARESTTTYYQQKQLIFHKKGKDKEPQSAWITDYSVKLSELCANDGENYYGQSKIIIIGDFNIGLENNVAFSLSIHDIPWLIYNLQEMTIAISQPMSMKGLGLTSNYL